MKNTAEYWEQSAIDAMDEASTFERTDPGMMDWLIRAQIQATLATAAAISEQTAEVKNNTDAIDAFWKAQWGEGPIDKENSDG